MVYLRQGALPQAIAVLEQGLRLCQDWPLPLRVLSLTAYLAYVYALAGRTADTLPLLEQAMAQTTARPYRGRQALWLTCLSEAFLLGGQGEAAVPLAEQALTLARAHQESGSEAWVLRLCGELAARRVSPATAPAETWYHQALTLANTLRMRPLQAHCHLGLGMLYHRYGQQEPARTELTRAMGLFQAMDMTLWLPQAEAALAEVGDAERR
jgi:tetratricopeptide (TPR) repeat protein